MHWLSSMEFMLSETLIDNMMSGHLKIRFLARTKFNELAQHLQEVMEESLPKMVDERMHFIKNARIFRQKFLRKSTMLSLTTFLHRSSAVCPRDQDDPHDDAHPEGENSAKRQKTSKHGTYVFRESSSGQTNESKPDDDDLPTEKVSQKLVAEMSKTVDEAKLRKFINEMSRQRCTSGDEHHYHIDQMQSFLKNDIMWESRK
ncbi:hypothetical protein Tco_0495819 [Tanacetum coccineum]